MWTVLMIFVALMVGWATPQPAWAKKLSDLVVSKFKGLTSKEDKNDFQG